MVGLSDIILEGDHYQGIIPAKFALIELHFELLLQMYMIMSSLTYIPGFAKKFFF
jgi:hypothetical protein